ncbi:MAG: DMT family transporter [Chitinophagaceae bacterium]
MKPANYKLVGVVATLLGAIGFSGKAILVKLAYRDTEVDTISLLALRMLFSLPFFLGMAFFVSKQSGNTKLTSKEWISVVVIGMFGYYISSFLDFWGLQYISAGLERLILFTYPTMVVFFGAVIYKKKITSFQLLALLLSYAGIALAFAADIQLGNNKNIVLGSLLVFTCAFTYAIYVFSSGQIIPKMGTVKFTSYAMLSATVGILLHYLFLNDFRFHLLHFSPKVYWYSIMMAVLTTVVPSLFVSEGIKRIGSSNVAIVSSVGPLATVAQAYIFLHEPFGWKQALGTALVVAGVILLGRKLSKDDFK